MIKLIEDNLETIISTLVLLLPLIYAMKSRIISDTNMLDTFKVAKDSILDSNNIKLNINDIAADVKRSIDRMEGDIWKAIEEVNHSVLEFQDGELYQKMLLGLSELDELHKTIQNKDATIEMLGKQIKESNLALQEIKNQLKG